MSQSTRTPSLSVLDLAPVPVGATPADALHRARALAQTAERLGFTRYWLAEHHNMVGIASAATAVAIGYVAEGTTTIRVGSGGIMLPNHSPLVIAEQFGTLASLYPGRIDLGLGRAPGSDGRTAHALNPAADTAADYFPSQVRDLLNWVRGERLVEGHPFRDITAQPAGPTAPEPWILGSSDYGAQVAGYFGLPFCFAHFITDGRGAEEALALYREGFRPSVALAQPQAALAVWAMAAETDAEVDRHFSSRALWRLGRDRGVYEPLPSPEQAAAYPYSETERVRTADMRTRAFAGTPGAVVTKLQETASALGVEEVIVLTTLHNAEARRRSYALLAEAASLTRAQVPMAAE